MDYPGHVVVKFTYNAKRPPTTPKDFVLINEYVLQTVHDSKPRCYITLYPLYKVKVVSIVVGLL